MTKTDTNSVKEADCFQCGGLGCLSASEPACCGNTTDNGECRSHCVIEQQIQIQCDLCGGGGKLPILELLK